MRKKNIVFATLIALTALINAITPFINAIQPLDRVGFSATDRKNL